MVGEPCREGLSSSILRSQFRLRSLGLLRIPGFRLWVFASMTLLLTVILVALVFEYINGFHDTANSIATVVSTKVLTPRQAVLLAAITNLLGAMWGTAVAKTISSGLVDSKLVSMTSDI